MKLKSLLLIVCLMAAALGACGDDVGTDADAGLTDGGGDAGVDDDGGDGGTEPSHRWVEQEGDYNVGYTEREVTYEADGVDEERTLRVAVWYPTEDEEGDKARYFDLLNRDGVWDGASVAIEEPAPLLVFSHGNGSLAEQSYFMTEFFASHGWIVVSPDHTGNTVSDSDGSIDMTSAVYRPQDITATLDDILDLPDDNRLAGLIDEERIAMSGHSFGGFTTLANTGGEFAIEELEEDCQEEETRECDILEEGEGYTDVFEGGFEDDRIRAAIPQTPGGYQAYRDGLAEIDVPTLLFTGAQDRTLPNEVEGDPIWEAMQDSGPHVRIDVTRGGHFTFSNMCELFPSVDQVEDDGCSDEFVPPEDAFYLINAYSLAFLQYHLFDDDSVAPLVEGDAQLERERDEFEMSR
ncbi:MAG: alpha/beta hydrolase family protein [Persicimonas sp.]